MYNLMKNLIVNKFYEAMEEAVKKLNVFFAVDDLTEEQFVELKQLAKEKYEIVKIEEKPVEIEDKKVEDNTEVVSQ
ncbi:hypothetical protein [Clostridium botulinum]|uniref:Uncharacterized protein n=1 Tax=Clostridium botulinum TaxID=1491 RepID=A0A6B4JIN9_CLOBO|nr:hypothetical protein [Clostridium botulinum]EES48093.1 hypothetical protein CLO_1437 [Clostridium botulinum E1 str. 'BoNT E Beluga']MBY6760584.1 hypothetical protein [Clostridium botulinum]MBY6919491.1 hypothetical protein [Clostridium botulinum]MBY6932055.1 hypothetical protein [Clostridium botulinum]MCR1130370.1 hypothetical protein [Clostridium botulinum]